MGQLTNRGLSGILMDTHVVMMVTDSQFCKKFHQVDTNNCIKLL